MDQIDRIVFINLAHRQDRFNEILEEFINYDFPIKKVERCEGIYEPTMGLIGCAKSHLKALRLAKEKGWKNVLILEDDFKIVVSKDQFYSSLQYFFDNIHTNYPWDVLMLAYNIAEQPHFHKVESFHNDSKIGRILFCQTASAYLVNSSYYDTLLQHYEEASRLIEETRQFWIYANDVYWKKLQMKDQWLYFKDRLSIQRISYSDNSNGIANPQC